MRVRGAGSSVQVPRATRRSARPRVIAGYAIRLPFAQTSAQVSAATSRYTAPDRKPDTGAKRRAGGGGPAAAVPAGDEADERLTVKSVGMW